jgi:hypothetical protein
VKQGQFWAHLRRCSKENICVYGCIESTIANGSSLDAHEKYACTKRNGDILLAIGSYREGVSVSFQAKRSMPHDPMMLDSHLGQDRCPVSGIVVKKLGIPSHIPAMTYAYMCLNAHNISVLDPESGVVITHGVIQGILGGVAMRVTTGRFP